MADNKIEYGASAAIAITLASLASDTSLLIGRQSDIVNNTVNKYLDYIVAGKITTGTTPTTARYLDVWLFGQVEDTPIYPDTLAGVDAARTLTSAEIKFNALANLASILVSATSNITYWIRPTSVASLFGGVVPKRWGVWVAHSSVAALHATGSNHAFWQTPVYATLI
jgi:hypothetical protein